MMEDDTIESDEPPNDLNDPEEQESDELDYDEQDLNLVLSFLQYEEGRVALKKLARRVARDVEDSWERTESYRNKNAEAWRMFCCDLPMKEFPFANCANAHVPIVHENVTRLYFRSCAEIFSDWGNVITAVPLGPDDDQEAEAVTRHSNWQTREAIPDFKNQMYRACLAFYLIGDVTCHSYYDPNRGMNRHEVLTPDDFVTPFMYSSTAPDYSDAPWVAKIMRKYRHELEQDVSLAQVDKVLEENPPDWNDDPSSALREVAKDIVGEDEGHEDSSRPYKLYWYEGWLLLPKQTRQRFCQVIVDSTTRTVLSLRINEEEDWRDRQRYMEQRAELDGYRTAQDVYARVQQELGQLDPVTAQGLPPITEPVPPAWMVDPTDPTEQPPEVRTVPIHLFSHGVLVDTLIGSQGMGYGRMLSELNSAANTILSQYIDAATLANIGTFVTAGAAGIDKDFRIYPGKVNQLDNVASADLNTAIKEIRLGQANPQMFDLLREFIDWGHVAMQSPQVLSGEPGKSGETFRGIAARIEQATKQMTFSARKLTEFLEQIYKNNARLNAKFLPESEVYHISDHIQQATQSLKIGRAMYEKSYKFVFVADLRFQPTPQRVAEADELLQLPKLVPPLQNNLAYLHAALKKALAARGQQDMMATIGPPPPAPQTPLGINQGPAPGAQAQPPGPPRQAGPGAAPPRPPNGAPRV